jgi:hypothetical protein
VASIVGEAKKAGLEVDENKLAKLVPSTLAVLCSKLGIPTVAALDQWLISLEDWRLKYLTEFSRISGGGMASRGFPVLALLVGSYRPQISKEDLEQQGYSGHTIALLFMAAELAPPESV